VVGDTVNLAARLCDAARPAGSTVASAVTISRGSPAGGYELLPALQVKGRASTVAAYRRPPAPGGLRPAADQPVAAEGLVEARGREKDRIANPD
jgi:class 3 adenylate cyclase